MHLVHRAAFGKVDRHRQNFLLEPARFRGGNGARVAFQRKFVQIFPAEPVFVSHHLGAHELAELGHVRIALADILPHVMLRHVGFLSEKQVGAHRGAGHALDAGGDHYVLGAGHYRLRRKVKGLL